MSMMSHVRLDVSAELTLGICQKEFILGSFMKICFKHQVWLKSPNYIGLLHEDLSSYVLLLLAT